MKKKLFLAEQMLLSFEKAIASFYWSNEDKQ